MIRIRLSHEPSPPRTLQDEDFIEEIETLAEAGFADAPPGPVTVEVLDEGGRLLWTAFYQSFARLSVLAEQLKHERA